MRGFAALLSPWCLFCIDFAFEFKPLVLFLLASQMVEQVLYMIDGVRFLGDHDFFARFVSAKALVCYGACVVLKYVQYSSWSALLLRRIAAT